MLDAVELTSRKTSASRCPYCHDMLEDGAALVTCDGCGTQHHQVCATELGRCSVLGCASLVIVDWLEGESVARQELRQRIRGRARRFLQAHTRRDRVAPGPTLRLRAEIVRAKEAWEAGDWPETRAARREILALEGSLEPREVLEVWEALGFDRDDLLQPDPIQARWASRAKQVQALLRAALLIAVLLGLGQALFELLVGLSLIP